MRSVLAIILGGGRGTRLFPLTKSRSKPAVPVAGKYRLIDIPISNCINSELHSIYVLTQFLSVSLHRHIANTYKFDMFSKGFVEVLAAQQTNESADWYQGTADAVRQNLSYIEREDPDEVLILSGDQLYRMDFRQLFETHRACKADITLAAIPVPERDTVGFGLLSMDAQSRVTGFVEKPKTPEERAPYYTSAEWIERRGIECRNRHYLANMGIYLFKTPVLYELLTAKPLATDFGKEVFPRNYKTKNICAHLFDGYWEDLGTIRSYHEASLALAGSNPPFDFFAPEGVIYTRMRNLPASRINGASLAQSVVADGCVIGADTRIERSLVGVRSRIGNNCLIRDTVVIGADKFETDAQRAENKKKGRPDLNIGNNSVIAQAILDKDCRIGHGVRLTNESGIQEMDGPGGSFHIRDGIICVPRGGIIPDGTVV
ncbi:Glucose-1-phosphate adenylyltransferase [Gemmata obscuriglobus]|uniref:Glucose-1-phosphate adenylyltransferase n=1 Tax=Gemmata obscuriglobus TaxID=114 RepID=A0A2Z3GY48_9BACT|nr:glucose-1-phosphate adenylyltransferase [Gemmata obscuriglobus]AWM36427.1 glucose-1-phosphate adenylyltransferase [Gemmata obscuriglobus]QEG30952.1 Glucose-1-phosphate adenylyltransferase [Gemmata obscuriglobus]VTS10285.1 glucose-1-phosphate adenylyltransferase : Glucose-1-phosphate adenylyltransferase OS=Singulisphaera acidiphila (strain ATCC BAA-1392 / DSM 18658 / VKM B-2454 / MOB10) GN=Sinac_1511 PE=3 SV=1: NTP_transferase [Gemmata obscuriglobus UQM 2246]